MPFVLFFLEIKYSFAISNEETVRVKYYSSRLSESQKNAIIQRIEIYFQQKPYLNAEFNMGHLPMNWAFLRLTFLKPLINILD